MQNPKNIIINNLDSIIPLLDFGNSNEFFYVIYIMTRNKDIPSLFNIPEKKQSNRVIKEYYVDNLEYLNRKFPEIIKLCEFFSARSYINLNRINKNKLGLEIMSQTLEKIKNGNNNFTNILSKSIGNSKTDKRIWVIDIDTKEYNFVNYIIDLINNIPPIGNKVHTVLPTVNGYHILSNPFNLSEFHNKEPDICVQKNNPTLLYYAN